jgi:hypothetical protein
MLGSLRAGRIDNPAFVYFSDIKSILPIGVPPTVYFIKYIVCISSAGQVIFKK